MPELGYTEKMGPELRREVERQLLDDLGRYGVEIAGLKVDWSDTCPEGHTTAYLDGTLENWSGVLVRDPRGTILAEGWLEFIHGGGNNPLFVFWEYLTIYEGDMARKAKRHPGIPLHIWEEMPEDSKALCANSDAYDAAWRNDPLVVE
jgi:hypothetical protein